MEAKQGSESANSSNLKTLITTILDKTMTKVSTLTSIEQQLSQHSSAHGPERAKYIKKKNKPRVSR